MKRKRKPVTLESLEPQYAAFCENVKAVKQSVYWNSYRNSAFDKGYEEKNEAVD